MCNLPLPFSLPAKAGACNLPASHAAYGKRLSAQQPTLKLRCSMPVGLDARPLESRFHATCSHTNFTETAVGGATTSQSYSSSLCLSLLQSTAGTAAKLQSRSTLGFLKNRSWQRKVHVDLGLRTTEEAGVFDAASGAREVIVTDLSHWLSHFVLETCGFKEAGLKARAEQARHLVLCAREKSVKTANWAPITW